MKKILPALAILLVLPTLVSAENHYVTQDGGGADFSAAQFNALSGTDYAGDTFYFSGTITTRVTPRISGTSGNYVTLDGYQAGDCDPLNSVCSSSALLTAYDTGTFAAMHVDKGDDYLIIQDFRMTNGGLAIYSSGTSAASSYITIQRNYIHDTNDRMFNMWRGTASTGPSYVTLDGNKMVGFGKSRDPPGGMQFNRNSHIIIKNNEFGHTGATECTSANTIEVHACSYMLWEYNEIYGAPNQAGLAVKEWSTNEGIIVRYNKIHDNAQKGMATGYVDGIYIYCNAFYNNGLNPDSVNHARTGIDIKDLATNVYIWSNLIYNQPRRGIWLWERADGPPGDIYIFNNVFANNGYSEESPSNLDTGLSISGSVTNLALKNNIFFKNRPQVSNGKHHQLDIVPSAVSNTNLNYNTYFQTDDTDAVMWNGEIYTLSELKTNTGQEDNGDFADPGFNNPSNNDYTLDGTNIDDGETLDTCFDIPIQGTNHHICYSDALHPSTDWTTTPPTVITASQNDHGSGWERGAYVYTGDEPQTCESLNGYCCISPQTCPGTDLGTYPDCTGTCCSQQCQSSPADTCLDRGFHCCNSCVPDTEHPENDTDCPDQFCCGDCFSTSVEYDLAATMTYFSPLIDGEPSEGAWRHANRITFSNPTRSDNLVEVRTLWNSDGIYFLYNVTDHDLEAANQSLWNDDGAELYLDTGNDKSTGMDSNDYHFTINIYDLTQEPDIQSVTKHDPNGYTMEMSIPWSGISIQPSFGMVIGLLLANNDRDGGVSSQFDWLGLIETGPYDRPNLWGDVLFTVRADSSRNGCIVMAELVPFIDSWKYDSTAYPMREMMEAVSLYYSPGAWC